MIKSLQIISQLVKEHGPTNAPLTFLACPTTQAKHFSVSSAYLLPHPFQCGSLNQLLVICLCCPFSPFYSCCFFSCSEPVLLKGPYFSLSPKPILSSVPPKPRHILPPPRCSGHLSKTLSDPTIPSSKLQRYPPERSVQSMLLNTVPKHMAANCLCALVFHSSLSPSFASNIPESSPVLIRILPSGYTPGTCAVTWSQPSESPMLGGRL